MSLNELNERLLEDSFCEPVNIKYLEENFECEYIILHQKDYLKPNEIKKIYELYKLLKIIIKKELEICVDEEITKDLFKINNDLIEKMEHIIKKFKPNNIRKLNKDFEDTHQLKYSFFEDQKEPYKILLIRESSHYKNKKKTYSYQRFSEDDINYVNNSINLCVTEERDEPNIIYKTNNSIHLDNKKTILVFMISLIVIGLLIYLF